MKRCSTLLLLLILVFSNGLVFGAPIDIPLSVKGVNQENADLHFSFELDFLSSRPLNDFNGEIKDASFSSIKFIGPLYRKNMTKANAYFSIGQVENAVYKAKLLGQDVKYNLDNSIFWEIGMNYAIGEFSDSNIIPVVDIKYRRAESMEYESVDVGSNTYSANELSLISDAKYNEWQAAFLLCKKIGAFLPYAGVKYSDVSVSAKVQAGGTIYDMNTTRSDSLFGGVLGCSVVLEDNFAVDVEGRFGNDIAMTLRGGYSF